MTKGSLLAAVALVTLASASTAQNAGTQQAKYKLFPNDKIEIGGNAGITYFLGDGGIDPSVSYGLGLYWRKALDYTISIRGGFDFMNLSSVNRVSSARDYSGIIASRPLNGTGNLKEANTQLYSFSFDYLLSLGNGRLESGRKEWNPYLFLGVGGGASGVKVTTTTNLQTGANPTELSRKYEIFAGVRIGFGLSYRLNENTSLGLDQAFMVPFGGSGDRFDGVAVPLSTTDFVSYTNVRLGFNIGGKDSKKAAPLWWASPADQINASIAELQARKQYDPTDTDGDGIIDAIDQEKESPAGARVDTRGVTLDSDGDKVPDFKDQEPFSPTGYPVDANGVAKVPKPKYLSESEVNDIVDRKLAAFKPTTTGTTTATVSSGVADWFLPIVHFDLGSATVKQNYFGDLKAVANVLKANPSLRIVVNGYADKSGADAANEGLSFRRAQAAIDHITKNYGVDRSRLVLNYAGENAPLVNTAAANYMNRRVEFKVATSESEMSAPAREVKSKKYKGAKNSGY